MKTLEVKFPLDDVRGIRETLLASNALFDGEDRQIDHCFRTARGHLKLRETQLDRDRLLACRARREGGSRLTETDAAPVEATDEVRRVLEAVLVPIAVVRKTRETFAEQNVRVHLDRLESGGTFVEIEVVLGPGESFESARNDARRWIERLGLQEGRAVAESYAELLAHPA